MSDILKHLEGARSVIISGHTRPDGDCVGACTGMAGFIREYYPDKKVDVRLETVPASYRSIPGAESVITDFEDDTRYDLFIALDASDRERLAGAVRYFDTAADTICIDHHVSNPGYANENLILPDASSTCEVLADVIGEDRISRSTAYALYTGIICDSGVFRYSCTSRHTMEVAGMLMEKGIPFTRMIDEEFFAKTYKQQRLLGEALLAARLELEGRIIISLMYRETMDAYEALSEDLEGIVAKMRETENVEVAIFASENKDGTYKFSLRSNEYVDVSEICQAFGGGGHVRAAGFTCRGDVNKTVCDIVKMAKKQICSHLAD